ncbi:MAG: hypothetical protein ABI843_00900 [Dokdonella sp.]
MYLNLATLPLPSMSESLNARRRRHRVSGLELDNGSLPRFQQIAQSLHSELPTPSVDAIASAARELMHRFSGSTHAPCIRLRRRCLTALRAMAVEPTWRLEPYKQERIALIADYAANEDRLIPEAMPVIGGLDAAVLVDLAWPSLRFELDDYLSFRRLRIEEATRRGVHPHETAYDRGQWLQARFAEHSLLAQARRHRSEGYVGQASACVFRIH